MVKAGGGWAPAELRGIEGMRLKVEWNEVRGCRGTVAGVVCVHGAAAASDARVEKRWKEIRESFVHGRVIPAVLGF